MLWLALWLTTTTQAQSPPATPVAGVESALYPSGPDPWELAAWKAAIDQYRATNQPPPVHVYFEFRFTAGTPPARWYEVAATNTVNGVVQSTSNYMVFGGYTAAACVVLSGPTLSGPWTFRQVYPRDGADKVFQETNDNAAQFYCVLDLPTP